MKVYHLTEIKNLYGDDGIASIGLIPKCGIRSKSINDNRIAISFTNKYYTLPVWWLYLYQDVSVEDLCVLSFDIEKKDAVNFNNNTEFFTNNTIPPEKISVAHFYNKQTKKEIPFLYLKENDLKSCGWGYDYEPVEIEIIEEPLTEFISKKKK